MTTYTKEQQVTLDRNEAIGALRDFARAANRLSSAWELLKDKSLLDAGYPEGLPSFDEFVLQVIAWRDAAEAADHG